MIISASRRTDIPALYGKWFIKRVKEGFVLVANPFNPSQITQVSLKAEDVDAFVFWTKNGMPFFDYLKEIKEYSYYFHWTITPYDRTIEKNVPQKNIIIDSFKRLSDIISPDKVIWRYDPVFFTQKYDYSKHLFYFEKISKLLSTYTKTCIYSFLTPYKKCEKNMSSIKFRLPEDPEIESLSKYFSEIASSYNISLSSCAIKTDLTKYGIKRGSCIDKDLISKISGKEINAPRDKNQREFCNCAKSIDIGSYNTCINGCIYCYANSNLFIAEKNYKRHNPDCEILNEIKKTKI